MSKNVAPGLLSLSRNLWQPSFVLPLFPIGSAKVGGFFLLCKHTAKIISGLFPPTLIINYFRPKIFSLFPNPPSPKPESTPRRAASAGFPEIKDPQKVADKEEESSFQRY